MERERVKEGDRYWFIKNNLEVISTIEAYWYEDNELYNAGNYFTTKEEALAMVNKIKLVLAGANVIEMPDEESSRDQMYKVIPMIEEETYNDKVILQRDGWRKCYEWIKSLIK